MLHCTLAHGGAWAGLARHLGGHLSMVAPDLLAHGAAPDADRTRDFHAQACQAAFTHLPDAPAHLIGHSFGATLALRIALDHPDRVRSLILIEPVLFCAADGPGRAARDADVAPMDTALAAGDLPAGARMFLGLWGTDNFDDLTQRQRSYITERIWIPAASAPALVEDNANLLARLPAVAAPTRLLSGASSPPVIAEINARLTRDIPGARAAVIPGADHRAPITHPCATAAEILRFLDAL
nr:alpha/beta hydrolase [Hasllibacter sp. MH4015]